MTTATKEFIKEFEYKGHKCAISQLPHLGLTYGEIDGEVYNVGFDCALADASRNPDQPSRFNAQEYEDHVTDILKKYVDSLEDKKS